MEFYSRFLNSFLTQSSDGRYEFDVSHLSLAELNILMLALGISVFLIAFLMTKFFRPKTLSAFLVVGPLPLFIAFIGIMEQFDRSKSATAMANALLLIVVGVGASIPACTVLARGILMHVNEQNRR